MPKVVFLRHGESTWNAENRFTGWADVDLSVQGVAEAKEAGKCLKEKGFKFDVIFTSMLRRAIKTTWHVCMESENFSMPIVNSWRLNERHYGGLQGLNKSETAKKHGEEQVKIWRRSYDIPPPSIDKSDSRHPANDPLYKDIPSSALPGAESLALTVDRAIPFWMDNIAPLVAGGMNVLVAAHGNSLRALCKHLEQLSEKDVLELNIPTAVPLVYELDSDLKFVKKYYLMDPAEVAKKLAAVAAQGSSSKPSYSPEPRVKAKDRIPSSIVLQSGKFAQLIQHAQYMKSVHLRNLLGDPARNDGMFVEWDDFVLDYCRQKVSPATMQMLFALATDTGVEKKRAAMYSGAIINETEGRPVLHVALRMPRTASCMVGGKNVVADVWSVLDAIKGFSDKVRSGEWKGHTGKPLTDVVCIGIGGSYLGVEFVVEALRTDPKAADKANGRNLRFLANVDPIDVKRALSGLSAETTLVVIVSKTFTTAETMLNARTVKDWLVKELGTEACVAKHVVACSTALDKTKAFGIDPNNVFGFWDWVGGRFSVWSAVGMLALSLQYSFDIMEEFLKGANLMDEHFRTAPAESNLPMITGLLAVWNASCLGYEGCAILPYCQALVRFVAHIQQLDMESNGKRVQMDGTTCTVSTGALYFGEPGTNGQHSFYQLMHQGRAIPAEFIGFKISQNPVKLDSEPVSNHDELMSNFFAQPDALALGKTATECKKEGIPDELIPHKTFPGDRPSLSLLLPRCDALTLGKLLALYEHRTAVQGWVWGINSFDQEGVQLGKVLGVRVRKYFQNEDKKPADRMGFMAPTQDCLASYLAPCCWTKLMAHASAMKSVHLRNLLTDANSSTRNDAMFVEGPGVILDYCRQKVTQETMQMLFALASEAGVEKKRTAMYNGAIINETEGRPALHIALRLPRSAKLTVDGKNVVTDVWSVLDSIKAFSDKVRSGEWKGHTGKALTDVVCIGIGGSYLGVEFVFEALRTDPKAAEKAKGKNLRFLANVDPIDVKRALSGLSAETTLVVIVSKTFTTAETMLNARTVKDWLIKELGSDACVAKHVVACSTALEKTKAFGIDPNNVFGFWDWVGGRFSVWSAVGMLALSLQYSFEIMEEFLQGAQLMDDHFCNAAPESNLPLLVGLLSVWNASCMGYEACAVLPYCQALVRFVAHVQQLDMESNGKRVQMDGTTCTTSTGALYFGEPGTNGQHSFYQLMHQGRAIPAEFIGFKVSQNPVKLDGEPVANHDELMSNFFAQPDALALGKTDADPHKTFPGDRPSLSMLLPVCDAKHLGILLALYEHRTAVQGWVWGINSFDQWGVQLGKVLATGVGKYVAQARKGPADGSKIIQPTRCLLDKYLEPYDSLAVLTHHAQIMRGTHLRTLLADGSRNDSMFVEACGVILDYCREKVSSETMAMLMKLAEERGLRKMMEAMFGGSRINETENRPVLHVALRMPRNATLTVDGKNVVPEVWSVLDAIKNFSDKVRSGEWKGHTGKPLTDVVCIGIGGSYLGVEFVFEALRTESKAAEKAKGRGLRFLANVDPIDVKRALSGLAAETTLVVIVSKTFTTAETMLNARTVKQWLISELGTEACVAKHVVACSTALDKTKAFGIDSNNVFGFWDWVGGRFSVWSAVGMLALSLQYSFDIMEEFLQGAQIMDDHFRSAAPESNLPVLIGLLAVWNASCLGYEGCAVLPYCQALVRFVAHIQQLDMESNGKRVELDGTTCTTSTGALYFGEPGTNGQHSFYQLMHQGRAIPAEFIGFKASQNPIQLDGEPVANHDELMSNFFAQPDALALGRTAAELKAEGVPDNLIPHKSFPGDRPSLSLLLPACDAKNLGILLALYEHRTAVQGWLWRINSFDQWGVQLGKELATDVRKYFTKARQAPADTSKFITPTRSLLDQYLPVQTWKGLFGHAQALKSTHLRTLLQDSARNDQMFIEADGIVLDYCRQKVTPYTMQLFKKLAEIVGVEEKKRGMFSGSKINETEGRSVLHVALRMPRNAELVVDGKNVVPEVWSVLDAIKGFSDRVRSGEWKGHTGKALTDVVCIGIGGSYLGVEFVFEALRTDPTASSKSQGRGLRFLANVDPIDVKRALSGLSAETTLVVVVSKTFTTAETMLNAKTVKKWLIDELGSESCVSKHVVACSTALDKTKDFGIDPNNVFGFWDWVGGRFSVWSAVGVLALSLQYSFDIVEQFLQGAQLMDKHFLSAPVDANMPMITGMLSVWNASCLGYEGCAILPYCQACVRFVAHIQQLDMESNGKRVQMDGATCSMPTGALYFGEPGTNGQHSFYQLMHQGRAIPAEFIGFKKSQNPVVLAGEPVSNHDELMSNFFAQPDALALGKTAEELRKEGVPENLVAHKTFPGDRPSLSLLLPECDAKTLGQLLALYEHRTAVQGWFWGINSFDQWGVQLGKVLATEVRSYLATSREGSAPSAQLPGQTQALLSEYLAQ